MVRPWVKISLFQYEEIKRLGERSGKQLSEIIREAVCELVKKKDFPVSTTAPHLPKGTRNKYKPISAYFPRSDWAILEKISENTGKCKTDLIRQAVDNYLGEHE